MRLFRRKEPAQGDRLTEILGGKEPPGLPRGVPTLMRLLRDPDSELEAVAEALAWDPLLVVRVLRTVNSSAFGLARPVDNVKRAITVLGRAKLEQLVLGIAVKERLPRTSVRGFEQGRFWRTAFFRAALARALAAKLHPEEAVQCFTGGLLQDMAVPLLAHARPQEYGPLLETWHEEPEAQLFQLERAALGWSHDEVGGRLAERWELPESLTRVIAFHHDEDDDTVPVALRLVAVHREKRPERGLQALVEGARACGLHPDWVVEAVRASETQADELAPRP